ncbi:MAG: phosphate acyltransferase PlsX [Pseudomonadota bacterium]|nr:phosphate acyltransferase PlsX [Pseudomonadota bacterium]
MQKTITIALDMMSGDHGLESSVPAALKSLSKHQELNLILVGDKDKISKILKDSDIKKYSGRLRINHTNEFIRMDDEVLNAIRYKKNSSMRLSINLVKDTTAHACVSAGNTGALMALSKIILKTMDGIDRPAICTALPTKNDLMHMLDLGANIECSEKHLFQFAIMGSALVQSLEINDRPKIGLLNIGSEEFKGNEIIRNASNLIDNSPLNYCGYVEGDDIFSGNYDVVVTDGFAGNIALKSIEGVANVIKHFIKGEFSRNILTKLSALICYPVMKAVKKKVDPRRYNGASLLGLNGIVVKSHGGADSFAFHRAIETAYYEARNNIQEKIRSYIESKIIND